MPKRYSSSADSSKLEEFNSYFELSLALSRKQRKEVYQLRYRVYCEEFGYESPELFSSHEEMDEFDCQSIHCLVTHRVSGQAAGCVRVVIVEDKDKMPMELHTGESLEQSFIESFSNQRETICEISRLAVDSSFRRRRRERETRFGNIENLTFSAEEQRSFPLIALALMLGAGAIADILNRKNCFAIMEPILPLMMKRVGIVFRRIGTDFVFRGVRAPYFANMDNLINQSPKELGEYLKVLEERFATPLLNLSHDDLYSSE